jgi:ABC-2 type transport system ATP-binding protein
MLIIEAAGLRKSFRVGRGRDTAVVPAVRGVDLAVPAGEIFGFLGPNGAGKTTTVRMLATLLRPDGGTARVAGHDLLTAPRDVRARIGYVSQAGGVDDGASVLGNLLLQAGLCRMPAVAARRRAAELLETFELSGLAARPARTLSGGQRRRLALALGLVHRPGLLFLDEPTIGLDPQARARLWDEVRALRASGTTVLLTTHYLDEADALCDRLAIIDQGEIVVGGTAAALKREIAGDVITLRLEPAAAARSGSPVAPAPAAAVDPAGAVDPAVPVDAAAPAGPAVPEVLVRQALAGLDSVRDLRVQGGDVRVYVDRGDQALPPLLAALTAAGHALAAVTLTRPSLDDVFLNRTGRSLRDAAPAPAPDHENPQDREFPHAS